MELKKKFEIEYRDPKELIPYVKNAKLHPDEQINKIAGQIAEFGFDQPIVINKENIIIKGHGRTLASIKLNLTQVPVIVQSLDEYQEMAARIADNKVSEAPWDAEMLKFDIGTLDLKGFNLELTGISAEELNNIINPLEIEREQGKGIEDYQDSHETTDIRQLILIMTQEDFDPMLEALLEIQEKQGLENNTEAVKYLIEFYENHNS